MRYKYLYEDDIIKTIDEAGEEGITLKNKRYARSCPLVYNAKTGKVLIHSNNTMTCPGSSEDKIICGFQTEKETHTHETWCEDCTTEKAFYFENKQFKMMNDVVCKHISDIEIDTITMESIFGEPVQQNKSLIKSSLDQADIDNLPLTTKEEI